LFIAYFLRRNSRPAGSTKEAVTNEGDRKYLIGGNWKCNGTLTEADALIKTYNEAGPFPSNTEVIVFPSAVHCHKLLNELRDDIQVGSQDCGVNASKGAYTGEVGAFQVKDMGCTWVLVGHSERRAGFGFRPGCPVILCATKAKVVVRSGLHCLFCIGEQKEERENGTTMDVCESQLQPLTRFFEEEDWANVAIAYEPVWAIGTGLTATPEMAQETHKNIRDWIAANVSANVAKSIRIVYGGSMNGKNAKGLLAQPDIDGGLIGGASLTADFVNVINGTL
jgi:triosephosphate isomerase